jgi:hypothetical protein
MTESEVPPITGPDEAASSASRHGKDRRPWYRRRAVLLTAGIAVILAIVVVTDLPLHGSRSVDISAAKSVVSQVNSDVGPCSYALSETFTIYKDETSHGLSSGDKAEVPGLLRDDQAACSFTDDSIYQLSTIEVPGSVAGKHLGQLVSIVTLWATSDALSAIEQVQALSTEPSNATDLAKLAKDIRLLGHDRAQAEAQFAAVDKILRTRLSSLDLTKVPASMQRVSS